MSVVGDALAALKNVVLLQERMDVMGRKVDRLSDDVSGLSAYAASIDKRVVRIETMIEISGASSSRPRIDG